MGGVAALRSNQLLHKELPIHMFMKNKLSRCLTMMTKNQINEREQLELLTIDQLVPEEYLVRKLEAAIDFSFIYSLKETIERVLRMRKKCMGCYG